MAQSPQIKQEYLVNKKLLNDPRITPFGQLLSKTSLDECPQFVNVLFGDMSLVEPRSYLLRERKDIGIYYASIIRCKPALTGMWQVNGRSESSFHKRCMIIIVIGQFS